METVEQVSDVRNADIVLNPELLVDFANCKYKAVKRIAFPSCPNSSSEIEAIQKYQQGLLKERWHPTTNDGYETFNGTLCSYADFRKLSIRVFGNVRLIFNRLQCDVDGIEKSFLPDGRRPAYSPLLIALSAQPSVLARKNSCPCLHYYR